MLPSSCSSPLWRKSSHPQIPTRLHLWQTSQFTTITCIQQSVRICTPASIQPVVSGTETLGDHRCAPICNSRIFRKWHLQTDVTESCDPIKTHSPGEEKSTWARPQLCPPHPHEYRTLGNQLPSANTGVAEKCSLDKISFPLTRQKMLFEIFNIYVISAYCVYITLQLWHFLKVIKKCYSITIISTSKYDLAFLYK